MDHSYLAYDFFRITGAIPGFLWLRPKLIYENDAARRRIRGGALLIANHVGFLDPVNLMVSIWYRRHHFICLKEFFNGRFRHWLFTCFHCIPIDRDRFSFQSLREITEHLEAGKLVTMFPEGHITGGTTLSSFKSGMVLLAHRSRKPVIPVYVVPRKNAFQRLRVIVGEPLDIYTELGAHPSLTDVNRMAEMLHDKEKALQELQGGRTGGKLK